MFCSIQALALAGSWDIADGWGIRSEPALILTDVREVLTRLARSPLLITKRDTAGEVLG
jgi:hypothetical protein